MRATSTVKHYCIDWYKYEDAVLMKMCLCVYQREREGKRARQKSIYRTSGSSRSDVCVDGLGVFWSGRHSGRSQQEPNECCIAVKSKEQTLGLSVCVCVRECVVLP